MKAASPRTRLTVRLRWKRRYQARPGNNRMVSVAPTLQHHPENAVSLRFNLQSNLGMASDPSRWRWSGTYRRFLMAMRLRSFSLLRPKDLPVRPCSKLHHLRMANPALLGPHHIRLDLNPRIRTLVTLQRSLHLMVPSIISSPRHTSPQPNLLPAQKTSTAKSPPSSRLSPLKSILTTCTTTLPAEPTQMPT